MQILKKFSTNLTDPLVTLYVADDDGNVYEDAPVDYINRSEIFGTLDEQSDIVEKRAINLAKRYQTMVNEKEAEAQREAENMAVWTQLVQNTDPIVIDPAVLTV